LKIAHYSYLVAPAAKITFAVALYSSQPRPYNDSLDRRPSHGHEIMARLGEEEEKGLPSPEMDSRVIRRYDRPEVERIEISASRVISRRVPPRSLLLLFFSPWLA